MRQDIAWALLGLAGALEVLACAGVLLMRDTLDRLHYAGAALLGAVVAAAAVLCRGGWSLIGTRAILLAALALVSGPVLTHATARTIHERRGRR